MSPFLALTLALTAAGPTVEGFGMTTVGSRPALTVFASVALQEVRVERSGNEVTVLLAGADFGPAFAGADRFAWTMPEGPGAIQIERRTSGVALRMSLSPDMPLDVLKQGRVVALVFGPRGSAPLVAPAPGPSPKPASPPPSRPLAEAKPEPPPAPPSPAPTPVQAVPSPAPSPPAPPRAAEKRKPEKPKEKAKEAKAQVLTVHTTRVDSRPALSVLLSRALPEASVERVGTEVIVSLAAEMPESIPGPPVEAPLEAIEIERRPEGVALHVRVSPDVPFQVRRGETLLTVVFGEEAAGQARAEAPAVQVPTEELYSRLFPGGGIAAAPQPPPAAPGAGETGSRERDALTLGPLALRPAVSVSYVNADTAVQAPQPVHDEYLQVQPTLSADLGISDGRLAFSYEPRLRILSSFSEVQEPSHIFGASLGLPVGARVNVGATDRFVRGTLETREVDFGGEYFFNLSRFTRNAVDAHADIEMGARLGLSVGGAWNHVSFDEIKGFFPYDAYSARAGVSYELTPKLRAKFDYGYSRVPPSDERPLVESTGHSANAGFNGDLSDFLTGSLSVGFLHQTSPEGGGGGGQRYSGLILSGALRHEFRPNTFAGLTLNRSTQLSNFEQNAFYVFTGGVVDVTVPVPFEVVLRGAVGYQWNTYQLRAAELTEPREDTIFGWGLGLGRPVGRRGFVRADYRRDRRNSNLPGFDITSDALILQLGVGLFGSSATSTR